MFESGLTDCLKANMYILACLEAVTSEIQNTLRN